MKYDTYEQRLTLIPEDVMHYLEINYVEVTDIQVKKKLLHVTTFIEQTFDFHNMTELVKLGLKGLIADPDEKHRFTLLFPSELTDTVGSVSRLLPKTFFGTEPTQWRTETDVEVRGALQRRLRALSCTLRFPRHLSLDACTSFIIDLVVDDYLTEALLVYEIQENMNTHMRIYIVDDDKTIVEDTLNFDLHHKVSPEDYNRLSDYYDETLTGLENIKRINILTS